MTLPRRIALLTSGPLCRSPRVLKEATTLGRAGFDVTVLTIANHERFEAFDREILAQAPFKKQVVDHIMRDRVSRFRVGPSRMATWLGRRVAPFGIELPYALGPRGPLQRLALRFRADLTVVHTELPLAIGVTMLDHGLQVAADFEDWHSRDLLPDAQQNRPLRLLQRVERRLMQNAAYTSTTSEAMSQALRSEYEGRAPLVLTNSFPLQPTMPESSDQKSLPSFFWFSQTIGNGRGLELFVAAWREMRLRSRLCLLGDVSTDYRNKLIQRVPERHRGLLEFIPLVSPDKLSGVIASHTIGLALEPRLPTNKDLTISNKILQYLNAGLAIVASGTAGQREVLTRAPGAGLIVNPSETGQMTRTLDELISNPAQLAQMRRASRHAAETHYSWEKEEPKLITAIESALAKPVVRQS